MNEKGLPLNDASGWPATRWNLLDGQAAWPLAVILESALESNVAVMAAYCRDHGVDLAPHAKTTMSPELFRRQLDAGAWGLSAATPWQVKMIRDLIDTHILLANVLVDPSAIRYVTREVDDHADFEFLCYVDSREGCEVVSELLGERRIERPLRVLIEMGYRHGRTGCRSVSDALELAEIVNRAPALELAGVAGFEGLIPGASRAGIQPVDSFLSVIRDLLYELDRRGLLRHLAEVIISAGGSAYFDRVIAQLKGLALTNPSRIILRSGCYVTHDTELYEDVSPLAGRRAPSDQLRLQPALELWASVLSRPEPDLAIVGVGKRDASYDYGLPIPLRYYDRRSGEATDVGGRVQVVDLNDQHAFVSLPQAIEMRPGDLIVCGLSHPCAVFDKWRAIPLVSDTLDVTDVVHTYF